MKQIVETSIDYVHTNDVIYISTSKRAYITKIKKFKDQYPNLVNIIAENEDGSIHASIPSKWFRFPQPSAKMRKAYDDVQQ